MKTSIQAYGSGVALADDHRCRSKIPFQPARASLIGTVDPAGPLKNAHSVNEGTLVLPCLKDNTPSARRAETAQGGVAESHGAALSLHGVNENLLLALAAAALKLIKRYADAVRASVHVDTPHNGIDKAAYTY